MLNKLKAVSTLSWALICCLNLYDPALYNPALNCVSMTSWALYAALLVLVYIPI